MLVGMLLAVLALSAAACGGSSKGASSAEFVKAGNALCEKAMQEFKAGLSNDTVASRAVALEQTKVAKLGTLTPPDELNRIYGQYKKALAYSLDVTRRYIAAVREKTSLHALRTETIQARIQEITLANALGLTACGGAII
jgi:hypothetical protein